MNKLNRQKRATKLIGNLIGLEKDLMKAIVEEVKATTENPNDRYPPC